MFTYCTGNILESHAQAIVNTVNAVGVMGKGLALQFKEAYPNNYKLYREACKRGEVRIGSMFITQDLYLDGTTFYIINFPTKTDWRKPSEYCYIEQGLNSLREEICRLGIQSIAIPPLGSHNGGLDWERVKLMIETQLKDVDCQIQIYQPSEVIHERMKKERVKLTPARAMLLDVMIDLVANGEIISEFSAEKIAYFLQRFGASDVFKLDFTPAVYGPYSGKVRYVLHYLNGSYIMGMSDLSKRPFDEIWLLPDVADDVSAVLDLPENESYKKITSQTKQFLHGYYSNYALELLATVDYLLNNNSQLQDWEEMPKDDVVQLLSKYISQWNMRKKRLFTNQSHINKVFQHIIQTSTRPC